MYKINQVPNSNMPQSNPILNTEAQANKEKQNKTSIVLVLNIIFIVLLILFVFNVIAGFFTTMELKFIGILVALSFQGGCILSLIYLITSIISKNKVHIIKSVVFFILFGLFLLYVIFSSLGHQQTLF